MTISEQNNRYGVTVNCNLTKFFIPIPIENKEARSVAKAIVEHVFLIYGFPKEILTDLGTEYCNQIFNEISSILKISHTNSTPYHPHTMGGIERSHRTLNEYLRSYITENNSEWDTYIKYFAFCYNSTPNTSFECKYSPFELVFGTKPNTIDILETYKLDPVYNLDSYSVELKHKLQTMNIAARNLLIHSKKKNKEFYDKKSNIISYNINEEVFLLNHARRKLQSRYKGTFTITNIDKENVELLDPKTNKTKWVHIDNICKTNNSLNA